MCKKKLKNIILYKINLLYNFLRILATYNNLVIFFVTAYILIFKINIEKCIMKNRINNLKDVLNSYANYIRYKMLKILLCLFCMIITDSGFFRLKQGNISQPEWTVGIWFNPLFYFPALKMCTLYRKKVKFHVMRFDTLEVF